ncbi:hypothetical protein K505DRAFT_404648 [Melanomma pulvis-pyrius CBS 109.77]|uniref:Rhodopsin domain-containing protein n=1 Tax=Melanomma pulvis-pyrius CBS 109.77 TaxID=1314802 RepID=A0A6A6XS52_9PLEO|nr:hypothetical protein K505DRAFT_404648 [Melanomma pulvis-pyrius CBS 109.77]
MSTNLDGPTIPSPDGVYELESPPNGNYIAIPVITLCAFLSAIFYLVRFYAKFATKKFNVADYLTVVAFPLYWVYIYYSYRLIWTSGYLVNMWNVRLKDITAFSHVCWIATLLYLASIALIKCAILLEWVNIFVPRGQNTYFTWVSYSTCGAITALSSILFVMDLANCTPFELNWNPLLVGGFCRFSVPQFALASAIANSVLDLIPLILAQKVIWGLHMSWTKKLGVSFIFLVGILGFVASIVRLYFATRFTSSNNTTYFFSIMGLCSLCETTCANIILCVPFTPKVVKVFQETRAFTEVKSYFTTKSPANSTSKSEALQGHELPRFSNSRTERLLGSSGTDRATVLSEHSARY